MVMPTNPLTNWLTHEIKFQSSKSKDLNGDAFRLPFLCAIPELSTPSTNSASAGSHQTLPFPVQTPSAEPPKIPISFIALIKFPAFTPSIRCLLRPYQARVDYG